MSFGVKLVSNTGKVYDSSSIPVMLYEVLDITGGSSGSRSYPELAGFSVDCAINKFTLDAVENLSDHYVTYDLGYPVVHWYPSRSGYSSAALSLYVFAW